MRLETFFSEVISIYMESGEVELITSPLELGKGPLLT